MGGGAVPGEGGGTSGGPTVQGEGALGGSGQGESAWGLGRVGKKLIHQIV